MKNVLEVTVSSVNTMYAGSEFAGRLHLTFVRSRVGSGHFIDVSQFM